MNPTIFINYEYLYVCMGIIDLDYGRYSNIVWFINIGLPLVTEKKLVIIEHKPNIN